MDTGLQSICYNAVNLGSGYCIIGLMVTASRIFLQNTQEEILPLFLIIPTSSIAVYFYLLNLQTPWCSTTMQYPLDNHTMMTYSIKKITS